MKAKTLDGREIDLPQAAVDGLRTRLKGPVLVAGDAGYDESRAVWNAMIFRTPALVVRCLGTADVIACVRFAREHRLLLCIKGGGHNIAGLAVADGALLLDMSLMRGVWVDARRKVARAQAGASWATWTARRSSTGWPPSSASSRRPGSPGSRWAAGSAT